VNFVGTALMSSSFQTIIALAIVFVTVGLLLYAAFRKKKPSGCASGGCPAVSPDIKKLQAKLKNN
jgi:FeoB-associated Cys-rich membrane protein